MSMTVNTNVNNVNWESLLASLGEVKKTDSVDGKQNFTITTNVDGAPRTVTVSVPNDLEIPETVDQGALNSLVDKLKATGLGFTDEQVAQMKDSIAKIFAGSTQAGSTVAAQSKGKVLFDLYALMALMIEVAQSQRDAAREMRTAENLAIQKAIQNQADDQRAAANTGLIVGISCGLAAATVSAGMMAWQGVTAKTQSNIMAQSGADSAKLHSAMLQNTDSKATAQAKFDDVVGAAGEQLASTVTHDFDSKLNTDQAGNLKTNLDQAVKAVNDAKADVPKKTQALEDAKELFIGRTAARDIALTERDSKSSVVETKTAEFNEKKTAYDNAVNNKAGDEAVNAAKIELDSAESSLNKAKTELDTAQKRYDTAQNAVADQNAKVAAAQRDLVIANEKVTTTENALTKAKADYVKTVQDVAAQYEDKYQKAVNDLNNPPRGADKAQLKADVKTARAKMEVAFAKEAQLLAQDNVMTPAEQKDLVAAARTRVDETVNRAMKRTEFRSAEFKMTMLQGINNINQSIGQVSQSTAQHLSSLKSAEATRQGADSKKEEEMLDQTKDLFAQEQKLIDQVVQLFSAVIQAESQSMRDAIQA